MNIGVSLLSMTDEDYIENAKRIATEAHAGQFRRDGVTPYIRHPEKVAEIVRRRGGDYEVIAAAWLHDVLEDTNTTAYDLKCQGVGEDVTQAVVALTHQENESYFDAINRAKKNAIARQVKIADNLANLGDSPTDRQIIKYSKSLGILMKD